MDNKAKEFSKILSKKLNHRDDFSKYEYEEFVEAGYIDLFKKLDFPLNHFKIETTNGYAAFLFKRIDSDEFIAMYAALPYEIVKISLFDNYELYYFSEAKVEMYEKKLFGNKTTFQEVRNFNIFLAVIAIIITILVIFLTVKGFVNSRLFAIWFLICLFTFFRIVDDERIYENKLKKKRETFIDGYKRGL